MEVIPKRKFPEAHQGKAIEKEEVDEINDSGHSGPALQETEESEDGELGMESGDETSIGISRSDH
jgi:hypothetical protein